MMRPTTPRGSRTEKFTTSGPIGIDEPFISVTSPAKNSVCAAAIIASLDHLGDRIAAVGGVDHRQLLRVLAQHLGDRGAACLARSSGSTWRQLLEGGLGRRDRGIHVGRARIGDLAERLAGAGIDRVGLAARLRRMPRAAVVAARCSGSVSVAGDGEPAKRGAHR